MTERFTLLSELGRGGMGVVWKARDEETGQIVAMKLLHPALAADADYIARFERELELAKRIHSAHVVKVLGFGARDGAPYLALEYVDGPSLRELLASHGPYSWRETNALLIQIAQGLADAHAAGVVHRDLKPSNVLIGPDGVAKLADFGIAKGLDLTRVTGTSTLLGTPAYLPPEGPIDERSDLYSLGIIAYELLTGVAPFAGTTYQEVIIRHIREAPDLGKLPPEARNLVGWLLAKDPAARPQRAPELMPVLYGATRVLAVSAVFQPPSRPASVVAQPPVAPALPNGPALQPIPQPMAPVAQPIRYAPTPPVIPAPQVRGPGLAQPPGWGGQRPTPGTTVALSARLASVGRYLGLGPGLALVGAVAVGVSGVLPWATVSWPGVASESVPNSGFDLMHSPLLLLAAAIAVLTLLVLLGSDDNAGRRSACEVTLVILGIATLAACGLAWQGFASSQTQTTPHIQFGVFVAVGGGASIVCGGALSGMTTRPRSAAR